MVGGPDRARVRWAGILFLVGTVQFVATMAAVQVAYPGYSVIANYISDLGNPATSPWAEAFNDSIRLLGVSGIIAVVLSVPAFDRRVLTRAGLGLVIVASFGAFLVGSFPEGSPELGHGIHSDASDLTFLAAGLALLVLAVSFRGQDRWRRLSLPSALGGAVTFTAILAFTLTAEAPGISERVIVAPILAWGAVIGRILWLEHDPDSEVVEVLRPARSPP